MCINTVSLPNVSRYDDISIYCCISNLRACRVLQFFCFYEIYGPSEAKITTKYQRE